MKNTPEELFTTAQAAEYLHLNVETIRRRIKDGSLSAYRIGPRKLFIRRADLDAFMTPTHPADTDGSEK